MIKIDDDVIDSYIRNDESFCLVKQYVILSEECAELAKAASKMARKILDNQHIDILSMPYAEYDKLRDDIVEEMAHVLVSCRVISKLAGITDSYIQAKIDEKQGKRDA